MSDHGETSSVAVLKRKEKGVENVVFRPRL